MEVQMDRNLNGSSQWKFKWIEVQMEVLNGSSNGS
jgi:hypothetical protein